MSSGAFRATLRIMQIIEARCIPGVLPSQPPQTHHSALTQHYTSTPSRCTHTAHQPHILTRTTHKHTEYFHHSNHHAARHGSPGCAVRWHFSHHHHRYRVSCMFHGRRIVKWQSDTRVLKEVSVWHPGLGCTLR